MIRMTLWSCTTLTDVATGLSTWLRIFRLTRHNAGRL